MKKSEFLAEIKQQACLTKRAEVAWNAAIATDEKDPRWTHVEELPDCIEDFAKVFGVILPAQPQRSQKSSPVERLEKQIAREEENHKHITNPEWIEMSAENIRSLKKRLAKIMSEQEA